MSDTIGGSSLTPNHDAPRIKKAMPWLIFVGCCLMSFVGYGLIVNTSGLYFDSLEKEFGVARAAVSLPVTIRDLIGALALSVAGLLMKKINAKVMLSVSVAVCGAAFILCSQLSAIWQFDVVFALIGISMVVPVMVAPAVLLSGWFTRRLGMVMGIALGLSGIGGAVMNPVIAAVIKGFGWRNGYLVTGVLLMVLILPFTLFVAKWKPQLSKAEVPYGETLQSFSAGSASADAGPSGARPASVVEAGIDAKVAYRSVTFISFVVTLILLQIISGYVQHISSFELSRGLSLSQGAVVVTGIMLGAAAGKATIGMLLDRFRAETVICAYVVVALVGWIGVALVGVPAVAAGAGFLSGLGQGYQLVAIPWMIRQSFGPKDYSEILSIATMFSNMMLALSVTIHGSIVDATGSYTTSFILVIVAYLLATVLGLWAYRKRPAYAAGAAGAGAAAGTDVSEESR
ncbi:MAG: MFS transporter [Bifidobacteriaceae bacterium]|jgi:MFS family permease|nr:MFS transporter [Bifidobacteriaceae bacterium]MCI1914915.1 MFS transporter [Bifidobacteriaceae bacterium]